MSGADALAAALGGGTCDTEGMDEKVTLFKTDMQVVETPGSGNCRESTVQQITTDLEDNDRKSMHTNQL